MLDWTTHFLVAIRCTLVKSLSVVYDSDSSLMLFRR